MVDGLKPGQRKILFCCFKRNIRKDVKARPRSSIPCILTPCFSRCGALSWIGSLPYQQAVALPATQSPCMLSTRVCPCG